MTPRWLPPAMLAVGGALLCLGIGAIVLGWYGAARTPYLFEQNSYLISGGLLGVGLTVAGGTVFCAAWLARIAADNRDALREIARRLDALEGGVGAPAASASLVATSKGTMVHRTDCPLVGGREDLRPVPTDRADGFRPCGVCAL